MINRHPKTLKVAPFQNLKAFSQQHDSCLKTNFFSTLLKQMLIPLECIQDAPGRYANMKSLTYYRLKCLKPT